MATSTRISISAESGKRIAKVVHRVERQFRGGAPGERAQANNQIIPLFPGVVGGSNIGAGSIGSPTGGSVTLWGWPQDGSTAAGDSVTAYNFYTGVITAGAFVWVGWFAGRYVIITVGC